MTLVTICSAKGAPGATTTATALCAAAVGSEHLPVLVELDAAGGSLAIDVQIGLDPGLLTLAAGARRGLSQSLFDNHVQTVPTGFEALVGPTSPDRAHSAVGSLAVPLADVLRNRPGLAVVDCGRWVPDSPATPLLRAADVAVIVVRPTAAGTEHVRTRLRSFGEHSARLHVVCVGDEPYPPNEVAAALGVARETHLAWDERAARLLRGGAPLDRWRRRSALLRSARTLLGTLEPSSVVEASA